MPPVFSVVIPTFNAASKLQASIESALCQNENGQAPLCEVWVIDGGSRDGTVELLEQWADNPLLKWKSEPDQGVYDAMNKAIECATGQFLYFLGAGDRLRPGVLKQVAATENLNAQTLLYGPVWLQHGRCLYGTRFELCDIARRNIPHQGAFYGRDIFKLVGNYNLNYPLFADHELNWRIFSSPKVETRFLDLVVADYEGGGLSETRSDPCFARDFPRLVWKRGGFTPWVCLQLFKRFPPERLRFLGAWRTLLSRRR